MNVLKASISCMICDLWLSNYYIGLIIEYIKTCLLSATTLNSCWKYGSILLETLIEYNPYSESVKPFLINRDSC